MCCSDDFAIHGDEQYPVQLQSPAGEEHPNNNEHPSADCIVYTPTTSAVGGTDTVCICTNTSANNQSGEIATVTNAQGENVYSEITSQLREHTTRCGTKESAGNELKSRQVPVTLGPAREQEKTCACPEEALYDQPVSLTRSTE